MHGLPVHPLPSPGREIQMGVHALAGVVEIYTACNINSVSARKHEKLDKVKASQGSLTEPELMLQTAIDSRHKNKAVVLSYIRTKRV